MAILSLAIALTFASQGQAQLIEDLGVESQGNNVANTAAGKLVALGDRVVPDLVAALDSNKERIRYYSVRCLGEIGTPSARKALIEAATRAKDPVRKDAAYALTWKPHVDATAVYIGSLSMERSAFHHVATIQALEAIKAKSALPVLDSLVHDPIWRKSYAAYCAQRTIRGTDSKIVKAVAFVRISKYTLNANQAKYNQAVATLRANKSAAMRDLVDILFFQMKAQPSGIEPSAETLIGEIGKPIFPLLQQAASDPDDAYNRFQVKKLVTRFGWQSSFPDLQQ